MLSAVRTKRYPHVHKKKKESEIKEIPEDNEILEEDALNLYTGDLVPNSNNTVQPIALMRLGLFVPTLKGTKNSSRNKSNMIDASRELVQLEVARSEGYSNIKITGPRLDMDHDFKTWVGVVRSLAEYGEPTGRVELSITKFAVLRLPVLADPQNPARPPDKQPAQDHAHDVVVPAHS